MTPLAGPGVVLPLAALAVALLMVATWAEGVRRKDISIVDPIWGPAFVLVALVGALAGAGDPARRWLLLALTAAWGLRLGIHLGRRKLGDPEEDRRYTVMRAKHEHFNLWALVMVFGTQGLLVLSVASATGPVDMRSSSSRAEGRAPDQRLTIRKRSRLTLATLPPASFEVAAST